MNAATANDLTAFYHFMGQKVQSPQPHASTQEVPDEWQAIRDLPLLTEDDLDAIEKALEDLANGDEASPLEQFDRELRERHGLPPRQ